MSVNLRAAGFLLMLASSVVACVKGLPIGGATCPCPAGFCCVGGRCVASSGRCDQLDGSVSPDLGGADKPSVPNTTPDGGLDEAGTEGSPDGPLTVACGQRVPVSFAIHCGGCHTVAGPSNPRYPDLYAFTGSATEFLAKTRGGAGESLHAYAPALITDQDVAAAYANFFGHNRAIDKTNLGSIVPLFSPRDVTNLPIVFRRDDGAIVTRGAGRVRGRHEADPSFMQWLVDYYQMRTYGWLIVDEDVQVTVTFLPLAPVTAMTNFRTWKAYDNGNVFKLNDALKPALSLPDMTVQGQNLAKTYAAPLIPYAQIQQGWVTTNQRTGNPIKPGDICEWELGIFYTADLQPPNSRTSYYTDQFRYRVGKGGITPENVDLYGGKGIAGPGPDAQQGGDGTNVWAYMNPELQFDQMALNIQHENVQDFAEGRRLFHTDFISGQHDGIGIGPFPEMAKKGDPQAQQSACVSCHINQGAGETIKDQLKGSSMLIRFPDGGPLGVQLQPQEGTAALMGTTGKMVKLADDTSVALTRPNIVVTAKDGTSPTFSARVATKLIGLGLLEAVDERTIIARADQDDCDGDGISGRPSLLTNTFADTARVGRFGWKAETATLDEVATEQAFETMKVGSFPFPEPNADSTDLDSPDEMKLETFLRLIAVPGQRDRVGAVLQGEKIFRRVGCAACHTTDLLTSPNHPFAELRSQAIKPYTDLLLHDLGPELADASGVPDPGATAAAPPSASEWRTAPLWGLGLATIVNGHVGLLHDGRAASIIEAILWHGGEAETAKQNVVNLSTADRLDLLAFLRSL
jgi:CxxC motif-containing protein (DUF1111 family)